MTPFSEPPVAATAPFRPSEVEGSVAVPVAGSGRARLLAFLGPGLLVSVGYMDPGNWATDLQAGSHYGYELLWVVVLSSLMAMLLQAFALRLGLAGGRDLARACREAYPRPVAIGLWLLAEAAVVACDIAEVLGSALALQLLFRIPLAWGVVLTAFDTVLVLGLKGQGFRRLEAIILALVATIAAAFALELVLVPPDLGQAARGLLPRSAVLRDPGMLLVAVGILGATVMPHNLYLHSSVVRTRAIAPGPAALRQALRLSTADTLISLSAALVVNAAILLLAGAGFHAAGGPRVEGIEDAYRLLTPLAGPAAAVAFGVGLLASGQSSTFTGTIAGQVVLEGFLELRIPSWARRAVTRALALGPALAGVLLLGPRSVGTLLVLTQVALSAQLPFAIYPLLRLTGRREIMGEHVAPPWMAAAGWACFVLITLANLWLIPESLRAL